MRPNILKNSDATYPHHIKSKLCSNGRVLIVAGYDYFLNKRDLRYLIRSYEEVILVPRSVDDNYLMNQKIKPLLEKYDNVHLVTDPAYDSRNDVIYSLAVIHSKVIKITDVFGFCEKELKKIYVSEDIENNMYDVRLNPFSWGIRIFKKTLDQFSTLLLLVLSSPFWVLSYFKIRKESPGSIFYQQKRIGLNQQEFDIIKFRSMKADAEANGAQFSSKNDDRAFSYGRLMRATRIDELPQLLNILKGEASLIGPRPERKIFTDSFEEQMPHYQLRHLVKPGITGYAQVMYPYGAGVRDVRHKLMYDLYYIKNWTLRLELQIILRTIWIVVSRKGI